MKKSILYGALGLFIVTLTAIQTHAVNAAGYTAFPRIIKTTFCWQTDTVDDSCLHQDIILQQDKTAVAHTAAGAQQGTWQYNFFTKNISIDFEANQVTYKGKKINPANWCFAGTMSSVYQKYQYQGIWQGCY